MLLCWVDVCVRACVRKCVYEQFSEIEFLKDAPDTVDCF